MNLGITRLVAANFGLCAFAVAIVAGLAAGNPAERILAGALVAMIICHFLGLGLGAVAERIVADHLAVYRAAHPLGDSAQSTKEGNRDRRP